MRRLHYYRVAPSRQPRSHLPSCSTSALMLRPGSIVTFLIYTQCMYAGAILCMHEAQNASRYRCVYTTDIDACAYAYMPEMAASLQQLGDWAATPNSCSWRKIISINAIRGEASTGKCMPFFNAWQRVHRMHRQCACDKAHERATKNSLFRIVFTK